MFFLLVKLPPESLAEFKALFLKEYGEELTEAEAEEQARSLLTLCSILLPLEK
jgi:hypothetical protein